MEVLIMHYELCIMNYELNLTTSPLRSTPLSGGIVASTLGYSYRCAFSCFARG